MRQFADIGRFSKRNRGMLRRALDETIASGFLIGGPQVEKFEKEFAEFTGTEFAIGVGNGLDALRLSLQALDIGPGDEVIVPGFTFYATWLAVAQVGATIVPVDVRLEDATIDPERIRAAITEKTKAIIVVHLYGNPANMEAIMPIADAAGVHVIEDAAQAHGAQVGDTKVGGFGTIGCFSFYPTKNLGAFGDAGAVTTSDKNLYLKIKSLRSYGTTVDKFTFEGLGTNSRLDPFQASFLTHRLKKLPRENARRSKTVKKYRDALPEHWGQVVGPENTMQSVWHLCVVRSPEKQRLQEHLAAHGIPTDTHYPYWIGGQQNLSPFIFQNELLENTCPNSKILSETVVSLPLGPWVTKGLEKTIEKALKDLPFNGNRTQ